MAAAGSGSFQDGRIASKRLMMLVALLLVSCCLGHGFGDEDHVEVEGIGSSCMESERRALLAIKSDMYDPDNWFSSWTGKDCCGWRGVACDNTTGHVTKLDLRYPDTYDVRDISDIMETMGGSKVNPSLQELKHLTYLDLSMNNFSHAPVPTMIASLVHLEYLNLSNAMFDGPIPPQFENLSNLHHLDLHGWYDDLHVDDLDWLSRIPSLKYLDMSYVDLSKATNWFYVINSISTLEVLHLIYVDLPYVPSRLPPFNLTAIATLDLSGNFIITSAMLSWLSNATSLENLFLSGCWSLTIESLQVALGALSNLKGLDLSDNSLEGEIREILNNVSSRGLKHLDLRSNQLSGDIPPGSLRDLEYLDLSGNSIVDVHILASLGNLTNLRHLELWGNSISGEIPPTVGKFVRLEYLDLSSNQLSGDIPPGSLRDLEYLDLSTNLIVDAHILASLGNLTNLRHLDLGGNSISGEIPPIVGDAVRLEYLYLSYNGIIGKIPQSMGNLSNLLELHLSGNKIVGWIPPSIGNLTNLVMLYLSSNNIVGCIPKTIGTLIHMKVLYLDDNQISGKIPETIGGLQNLQVLYLDNNFITGEIPATIGGLRNLLMLSLSNNLISGPIPETIGGLRNLQMLILKGAELPAWLQTQTQLTTLDLYGVGLSGNLPVWFSNFTRRLHRLNMSSNNLQGRLPSAPQLMLDLSNNSFIGPIPPSFVISTGLSLLSLSHNRINGSLPPSFVICNHFRSLTYLIIT
uniref:Leucine-rich repeat-containing N-terminal plant-type domain-containing protein n=1 Tax=Musa acuminata subsp. malaccensis TaxID=214687 RepID=A0A804IHW6_MUSAM